MGRWLALVILVWPLLEIAGLVWLSGRIGLGLTLASVVLGFLVGLALLRRTGLQAVQKLRLAMDRGQEPGHTLIDAASFAVAGILLIVPGPLSDALALLIMLPWSRALVLRAMARQFEARVAVHQSVIKGEYEVVNEDPPSRPSDVTRLGPPGWAEKDGAEKDGDFTDGNRR